MILPTKRLSSNRALITIGAIILNLLNRPKSISLLWEDFKKIKSTGSNSCYITYDWFILSLDMLYSMGIIKIDSGRISRLK
jgi:hypothetical protein